MTKQKPKTRSITMTDDDWEMIRSFVDGTRDFYNISHFFAKVLIDYIEARTKDDND